MTVFGLKQGIEDVDVLTKWTGTWGELKVARGIDQSQPLGEKGRLLIEVPREWNMLPNKGE